MTTFTILKSAALQTLPLVKAGQRASADRGDPQIAIQQLAPEATGNLRV
ncbi:hypothetical protein [Pseudomonas nitroreducens]|nr:hypothetical protein [Pseudomonas nitroreducens]